MHSAVPLITQRQEKFLVWLIYQVGKVAYRQSKVTLGIDLDKPLTKLSKTEAHMLITHITGQLEAAR